MSPAGMICLTLKSKMAFAAAKRGQHLSQRFPPLPCFACLIKEDCITIVDGVKYRVNIAMYSRKKRQISSGLFAGILLSYPPMPHCNKHSIAFKESTDLFRRSSILVLGPALTDAISYWCHVTPQLARAGPF